MLSIWNFEYASQTTKFKGLYSFFNSAERVHASHPYRAVDMTMALRSLIFVFTEIDLLLSSGCNFANAVVAVASLDFISVFSLPSLIGVPKYLKDSTCSRVFRLTFISGCVFAVAIAII